MSVNTGLWSLLCTAWESQLAHPARSVPERTERAAGHEAITKLL